MPAYHIVKIGELRCALRGSEEPFFHLEEGSIAYAKSCIRAGSIGG